MYKIEQVTNDSYQKQTLVLADKSKIQLTIYYAPMQYGWFIKEIKYGDFTLNGIRICNSPNLLHQWRNIVPFGLACYTVDPREPMFSQDFSSGISTLFILTAEECETFNQVILHG